MLAGYDFATWRDGEGGERRCTFDCWVIFIDEMTLYQLDSQAGLSNTTSTYNNELILS